MYWNLYHTIYVNSSSRYIFWELTPRVGDRVIISWFPWLFILLGHTCRYIPYMRPSHTRTMCTRYKSVSLNQDSHLAAGQYWIIYIHAHTHTRTHAHTHTHTHTHTHISYPVKMKFICAPRDHASPEWNDHWLDNIINRWSSVLDVDGSYEVADVRPSIPGARVSTCRRKSRLSHKRIWRKLTRPDPSNRNKQLSWGWRLRNKMKCFLPDKVMTYFCDPDPFF